jgi:ferredoxin-NADP reductase
MSDLIAEELARGDRLQVSNPTGLCFYEGADPERPIVLAGAGAGLAPLWGIVRDALQQQHRGLIRLYNGARERASLYLVEELQALADRHESSLRTGPTRTRPTKFRDRCPARCPD